MALAGATMAPAQGGPPLLTDDPGTVSPGKWEINLAWVHRRLPGRIENELPHLDAAHGFTRNAQFKLEVPWVFAAEDGRTMNGDGGFSTGVKWRFFEGKGSLPAISTYPQVGFSLEPRSVRLGLAEGGTSLLLPIEMQWASSGFDLNADAGVFYQAGAAPGWLGGVAVGRELWGVEWLAEIHGEGVASTGESNWVEQLGFRRDLGKSATLLFALGRTFAENRSDALSWTSYVGIQLRY